MSHPWFCDAVCQAHCALEDLDDFVSPPERASTALFDATMAMRALLQPVQRTKWSQADQARDQDNLLAWLKAQLPAMVRASRAHAKQRKQRELIRKAEEMAAVVATIAATAAPPDALRMHSKPLACSECMKARRTCAPLCMLASRRSATRSRSRKRRSSMQRSRRSHTPTPCRDE